MNRSATWDKSPPKASERHGQRITDHDPSAAHPPPEVVVQRQLGNQWAQHLLRARRLQAKLTVSDPNDIYEQEADRVADAVMRMPEPTVGISPTRTPHVQRLCPGCEDELKRQPLEEEELHAKPAIPELTLRRQPLEEEEEPLQAKRIGKESPRVSPATEDAIHSLRGRGQPLPDSLRTFMEPRFHADFRAVRVHADADSGDLARTVNAQAFTVGRDIVFGAGHYAPDTERGRHLIAHELTHVVQQDGERTADAAHRSPCLVQRDVVTFEEGSTIVVGQSLGPHLYNEIDSGLTIEPAPGLSIGFWYRIYEARPGVDIDRLYADLTTLYGYGRFTNLTRSAAAYLGTRSTPRVDRFFALYPNRRSREPIDLSRLGALAHGLAEPREVAQPGITAGFTERGEEAWTTLAPTARVYINDWADWSLRGLDRFLEEIPMEEDRSVQNALSVFGNIVWALTAFIPVVGPITRAVAGTVSLAGALTASFASIAPGTDLNTERKRRIRRLQEAEVTRFADGLEQQDRLSPILITVLVKAQERGMPASERDALLWNHMFDIPYSAADSGRRARLLQRAYGTLRTSWGQRIR